MAAPHTRLPPAVLGGLVLAVVLDTFIQVTWKYAVADVPADATLGVAARAVLASPAFYGAMALFGGQMFNWMRVLARADLSFAQPITALSYISVLAISSRVLHEQIGPTRLAGVALILIGVFCISRTPHQTADAPRATDATP